MLFRYQSYKRITCLLLLVMYVCFLVFQAKYTVEVVAGMAWPKCKTAYCWSDDSQQEQVSQHTADDFVCKIKAKPSKRFHPNAANIEQDSFSAPVSQPMARTLAVYHAPFFQNTSYQISLLRGPPVA